jgi:hypothetical protein
LVLVSPERGTAELWAHEQASQIYSLWSPWQTLAQIRPLVLKVTHSHGNSCLEEGGGGPQKRP